MQDYESIFTYLQQDLTDWVLNNPKTGGNISGKNLKYLFVFNKKNILEIDLTRFNDDYYFRVFAYVIGQKNTEAFIKKVCLKIRDRLVKENKYGLMVNISVRNKLTIITKNVYVYPGYK